jgi:hypothetical protein
MEDEESSVKWNNRVITNYTKTKNTMYKNRSWLKIVVFYIPMLSGFIFR